jgi:FkbM family methyltransferase
VPDEVLVSYAQNGEDIVLWRALRHLSEGVYVDVGGWDPDVDSVTRLFYEAGWRGIDVEPIPEFAERFRERRPGNEVVQAVITDEPVDQVVLHRFGGTGLSTVDDQIARRHDEEGLARQDITVPARRLDDVLAASALVEGTIHFLKVDVEGAEEQVLRSVDLGHWRPWVLVVEATEPNSTQTTHGAWEPLLLAAGYTFTLFDGLSRFYVSPDHPELAAALSYPACALDEYQKVREVEMHHEVARLRRALDEAHATVERSEREADRAADEAQQLRAAVQTLQERVERLRTQRKELRQRVRRLRRRSRRRAERIRELRQAPTQPAPGRLRRLLRP